MPGVMGPYAAHHPRPTLEPQKEGEIMLTRIVTVLACLFATAAVSYADDYHPTYEMRRINVLDGGQTQSRCHFTPGLVKHISDIGGLPAEQNIPLVADDAQIQALVDAAVGVTPPSFDGLSKGFTNWWVRSGPNAPWKLIRSNTSDNPGGVVLQDESQAGQRLAVFMGVNCLRTFGQ
jgi:hypothetical protein